jgi:hypothetical protein
MQQYVPVGEFARYRRTFSKTSPAVSALDGYWGSRVSEAHVERALLPDAFDSVSQEPPTPSLCNAPPM